MRRPPLWLFLALAASLALGWYVRRQISNETFLYAGADSYGFIKAAEQLYLHHRYALGPEPEPLTYVRPPLYAIFLSVVKRDLPALMSGGPGWWPIVNAQRWIDLLLTGAGVYFIAAAIRRRAGLLAHGMMMIFPLTVVFFAAVFTETLAICLTAAAFAFIAADSPRGERSRYFAAGATAALGTLLRQDGILLVPPLLLAVWLLPRERPVRLRLAGWLLLGFTVAFSPWPVRNLIQFGKPWPFGTHADRFSRPIPYYSGYYAWLTTWADDYEAYPQASWCFYDPTCGPQTSTYPRKAFDSPEEKQEVDRLFALRRTELYSQRVSDGFAALAHTRRWHHPINNYVRMPATRAWNAWINEHTDITHGRVPWPAVWDKMRGHWTRFIELWCLAAMAAAAWLIRRPDTRRLALVLSCAIVLRTLFLAYFFYVEPRYTVEVMPLQVALIAGALVLLAEKLRKKAEAA